MPNANYLIAQQIPDVFRQESRNVGVIVRVGERITGRFFGEMPGGRLDGRKIQSVEAPEVYRQWVEYWRSAIRRGDEGWDEIIDCTKENYRLVRGGTVSDIGDDSADVVANYLYSLLVSEGGFVEALGLKQKDEPDPVKLTTEVTDTLRSFNLLITGADDALYVKVRHPVRTGIEVPGKKIAHVPSFVQENGRLYVIESVDLGRRGRSEAEYRAGFAAYTFGDIRNAAQEQHKVMHGTAIVRRTIEDERRPEIQTAMRLLEAEADEIVNWESDAEREKFIEERQRVAMSDTP